jgi:death on curing protein
VKTASPEFLTVEEVMLIHEDQIERYGGQSGTRDKGLLSSAVGMPEATFAGHFLHQDIFEMAAAYAFHISQNHPFVDGNKRTGLATCLVFLVLNGVDLDDPEGLLYPAMMDVASGKTGKSAFAEILRKLAR